MAVGALMTMAGIVGVAPAGAQTPGVYAYVANGLGNSVTEYAPGASGDVAPSTTIAGADTGLDAPTFSAFDSSGTLYVTNGNNNSVTEYAPGASGDATPVATIAGAATGLDEPQAGVFDASGDLWVTNIEATR